MAMIVIMIIMNTMVVEEGEGDMVVVEQGRLEGMVEEVRVCCIRILCFIILYPLTEQLECFFYLLFQVVDRFLLMI